MKAKLTPAERKERLALIQKGQSISLLSMRLFLAGKSVDEVFTAVKKAFPKGQSTRSSTAWYKSELKRMGFKVPEPIRIVPPKAKARKAVA